jgi:intracellular multiplication protein IcmQ
MTNEAINRIDKELQKLARLTDGFKNRLDPEKQPLEKDYLTEAMQQLNKFSQDIRATDVNVTHPLEQMLQIVQKALDADSQLREKYQIGVHYNVIHTQLEALLNQLNEKVQEKKATEESKEIALKIEADRSTVYVYLFNAQGSILKTWQKLLLPGALVEHSVNRPIYAEKEQIENVMRAKPNQTKLAYLEIMVNKDDILQLATGNAMKDQHGYPLLRLRQGALKVENIKNFVHNGKTYQIFDGSLVASDDYCKLETHE